MGRKYDYLVVGAGLFGATFARCMSEQGKKCLVIDRRPHVAGNAYTRRLADIDVHVYGAHIFHTSNERVWRYVNRFAEFNRYTNAPIANYRGEIYNLPFNMNTFYRMWGTVTPEEARARIERGRAACGEGEAKNLEEQAIRLVGTEIYERLVKGYTEKQWGRDCRALPPFIIRRLPVRFTYDNSYFNDRYQGIPTDGYTAMVSRMLAESEVRLGVDFLADRAALSALAERIVYTGAVDAYFGYRYGRLAYRGLRFETELLDVENYQGNAVVNYTDRETPYTRIIEHKHFTFGQQPRTVISREYPSEWQVGEEPYYPINDEENNVRYGQYRALADREKGVIFGGRLGEYRYYDMDGVIASALDVAARQTEDGAR